MAKTELEIRSKAFALQLIELVERMPRAKASEIIGRQLLRAGTSLGANYREANRAESRADFVHKVGIAVKEAAETEYWLELINESRQLQTVGAEDMLKEARELLAILITIGKKAALSKS